MAIRAFVDDVSAIIAASNSTSAAVGDIMNSGAELLAATTGHSVWNTSMNHDIHDNGKHEIWGNSTSDTVWGHPTDFYGNYNS